MTFTGILREAFSWITYAGTRPLQKSVLQHVVVVLEKD